MYGGEGNDVFWGGEGDDLMYGGADNDVYFINFGDGNDTIEDKEGKNKVYFCGEEINFFYQDGDGYVSISGNLTASIVDGHFDVTDGNGTTVRLNENFDWGDFGTTLITLPANPDINNTIYGTSEGYPDEELDDTALNDKIYAGGGDDYVLCDVGGANWILGGEGLDSIDGELSSSCIVEGGAGSDIIFGGVNGNNQLFGDSRGGDGDLATVMATHIAYGETAPDSGTRGDIISENHSFEPTRGGSPAGFRTLDKADNA
jgi:Ca2+-binding RTX toxin-like protein